MRGIVLAPNPVKRRLYPHLHHLATHVHPVAVATRVITKRPGSSTHRYNIYRTHY